MAVRHIYLYPSQTLRTVSQEVGWTKSIEGLIRDMRDTLGKHEAAGLSAIQIGDPQRVVLMSKRAYGPEDLVLINPEVIGTTGDVKMVDEGCLSVPHVRAKMGRHECVLVSFYDENGVQKEEKFKDLAAQCIEHEMEHLDGKIFIDQFPGFKAGEIRTAMQNYWRNNFKVARKTYKMG